MNWTNNITQQLFYEMVEKDTYTIKQKQSMRRFCCKQLNPICVYCGGTYRKASGCTRIDSGSLKPCCQLCYVITHFIPNYAKMLIICKSVMPQLEIIRSTVDFIHKYKKAPSITDIDGNAICTPDTPTHFFKAYMSASDNERHEVFEQYKIFYTSSIDMTNIILGIVDTSQDFSNFVIEDSIIEYDVSSTRKIETMSRLARWYTKIHELNCSISKIEQLQAEIIMKH
jgi:hypothetical protein